MQLAVRNRQSAASLCLTALPTVASLGDASWPAVRALVDDDGSELGDDRLGRFEHVRA